MKKYILGKYRLLKIVFLLLPLGFNNGFAQLGTPPSSAEKAYLSFSNLLKNPGFESGKSYWTASGGTFTTTTSTSNVATGTSSGDWDSNSANQTLSATAITANAGQGMNGATFIGACRLKAASGTPTHKIELFDGSSVVSSQTITTNTTGYTLNVTPPYIVPTSGSVSLQLRLESINANEPEIFIDDCNFLNLQSPVAGPTTWQPYTPTFTGLGTVSAVSAFYRKVGDSLEVSGKVTSGTVAAATVSISLPSGFSFDTTKMTSNLTNHLGFATRGDGTNQNLPAAAYGPWPVVDNISNSTTAVYIATQSNAMFNLTNGNAFLNNGNSLSYRFSVPIAQ